MRVESFLVDVLGRWFKPKPLIDGLGFLALQKGQPLYCRVRMRSVLHHAARIDCSCVQPIGNRNALDGIANPLLKANLGGPRNAGVGSAVHDAYGRLPVMDFGEQRFTALHFGLIHGLLERPAAGLAQRIGDLPGNALPLGVRHGQKKVGPGEVPQRVNLPGIAGVNHNFEVVGRVLNDVPD